MVILAIKRIISFAVYSPIVLIIYSVMACIEHKEMIICSSKSHLISRLAIEISSHKHGLVGAAAIERRRE